ncbi:MAG: FAD-dependent protein, partial [Ginsengibacter sp.]
LVQQVEKRGVFSFCMCPGGIIAPAATNADELVVNGWSPSKRNNPYANSGMVVQVEKEDVIKYFSKQKIQYQKDSSLLLMNFQAEVEQHCFLAGGGKFIAPAQRLADFTDNQTSSSLPHCSYIPGVSSTNLNEILPAFISNKLREAFKMFGKKLRGKNSWLTNEAIVVATESRTSSPVKIPRLNDTLAHPQLDNFYPCGEGAGYAGGIVSAAMDGERVATEILKKIKAFRLYIN